MAPKHFMLIHDACQGKWIWDKFTPLLKEAGHEVTTFDLVASGDDPRQIESVESADQYTSPLLDELKKIPVGKKVILVGHGLGGINAAIAMDEYPEKVERAVFLNALLPDTTHSPSYVIEQYMDRFHDWEDCKREKYNINNLEISKITLGPTFVRHHLFVSCSDQDYQYALSKIRTGSFFLEPLAMRKKFTEGGYGLIPKVFISSKMDIGIPVEFQNWEIKNFPVNPVYTIEGDHSPMYTNPKALLEIFHKIASA